MKKLFILLVVVLLVVLTASTGCLESETITKTGYVEDIDFAGGLLFRR